MPKYGFFSGPYFPAFSPNKRKYGLEKTPCLDIFHSVHVELMENKLSKSIGILFKASHDLN